VTFWLGVAVEGRRADQNEQTAHREATQREAVQAEANRVRTRASAALAEASGALVPATAAAATGGEARAGRAAAPDLGHVKDILDRARVTSRRSSGRLKCCHPRAASLVASGRIPVQAILASLDALETSD
jgi:hypothetical protein